jgi:hypothetical protein
MAGVIVRPREPDWRDYIGQAVAQLGSGAINAMFERDANARNMKAKEAMMQKEFDMRNQQNQMDMQSLQSSGLPSETIQAIVASKLGMGKEAIDYLKFQNPDQTLVNEDMGGQRMVGSFNPRSGAISNREFINETLDPNTKAEIEGRQSVANTNAASARSVAGINAGASKYRADKQYGAAQGPKYGAPVQGDDGMYYRPGNDGSMMNTNVKAPSRFDVGEAGNAVKALDPFGESDDPRIADLKSKVIDTLLGSPEQLTGDGMDYGVDENSNNAPRVPGDAPQMFGGGTQIPSLDDDLNGQQLTRYQVEKIMEQYGATVDQIKQTGAILVDY